MSDKSNADDARIIMQLYDLRREVEMRKARAWFAGWWPRSADEIVQMKNPSFSRGSSPEGKLTIFASANGEGRGADRRGT